MMGDDFCKCQEKDQIFVLTLVGGNVGHNYLTLNSLVQLLEKLKEIRRKAEASRTSFKGLITNGEAGRGAFTDGVDYDNTHPDVLAEMTYLMAEAVHELYNMPFPTVAAVNGAARTTLGMALVLAHDEIAAAKDVVFEVPEVRARMRTGGGQLLPPYFASLLRGRAQYAGMRTSMVLQGKAMSVSDMAYGYECKNDGEDDARGIKIASSIIKKSFGKVRDGQVFVTTRKSFYPEGWKAVSDFLADQEIALLPLQRTRTSSSSRVSQTKR